MKRHLSRNVALEKVPRKGECEECKKKEEVLADRDWRSIKFFVHTLIQRNKAFNRVDF